MTENNANEKKNESCCAGMQAMMQSGMCEQNEIMLPSGRENDGDDGQMLHACRQNGISGKITIIGTGWEHEHEQEQSKLLRAGK